jgi:hypothetical protein
MFLETLSCWLEQAEDKKRISVKVAVNTKEQSAEIKNAAIPNIEEIEIVGEDRPGVAFPTYVLGKKLVALPGDTVILASDDFYPKKDWDKWVLSHFTEQFHGCLLINDGHQTENCVTIPIMDYACLFRLNKIIYHPLYKHQYSDNELYDNLKALNFLKDLRNLPTMFEHRHWHCGKRDKDEVDEFILKSTEEDFNTYKSRSKLSVTERLTV